MLRLAEILACVIFVSGCKPISQDSTAEDRCNIPASHPWERAATTTFDSARPIPSELIRPVIDDVQGAVIALSHVASKRLSDADAKRYSGGKLSADHRHLYPYLVRAVYPSEQPAINILRSGDDLLISTSGLGCAPFVGHPIIVLLPAPPAQIFVQAGAAL